MPECRWVQDRLADYMNRQLCEEDEAVLLHHLAACPECRSALAEFIFLKNLSDAFLEDVPEEISNSAYDKICCLPANPKPSVEKSISDVIVLCLDYPMNVIRTILSLVSKVSKLYEEGLYA
jgi:anti-sigma factor ChrR (cupin superfamily)